MVDTARYAPADEAVRTNDTQFFRPVPQEVWDFHIGGYRVLDGYVALEPARLKTRSRGTLW